MEQTVKKGDTVIFHYLGKLDDGKVFVGSNQDQPIQAVIGQNVILPALEMALEGMKAGEQKKVRIMPSDAYGEHDSKLVIEYPKEKIPQDPEPKPGMVIEMTTDEGKKMLARIVEIKGDVVVIDMNHPLADQALNFEIQLLAINPIPSQDNA